MKLQLIMLKDPIIVSDEEIKEGDYYYEPTSEAPINKAFKNFNKVYYRNKLIAQSHQIDWNGLEAEFGYVDVEKLAKQDIPDAMSNYGKRDGTIETSINYNRGHQETWKKGFKKAQELNDKKFSLEDMRRIYLQGYAEGYNHIGELNEEEFKKKLSKPKIFDIELEMEPTEDSVRLRNQEIDYRGHSEIELESVIKVTEGKIKITKKL